MLLSRFAFFCFFFLLFLFFSGQKAKKSKIKANLESKINAKNMHMTNSIFLTFWHSFFSPFILHLFFFSFEVLLFWLSMCFPCFFFAFFSSLKIIRMSNWGEHKLSTIGSHLAEALAAAGLLQRWGTGARLMDGCTVGALKMQAETGIGWETAGFTEYSIYFCRTTTISQFCWQSKQHLARMVRLMCSLDCNWIQVVSSAGYNPH